MRQINETRRSASEKRVKDIKRAAATDKVKDLRPIEPRSLGARHIVEGPHDLRS